jgi:transcriptional regulator with XRE-family HTH domain
VSVPRTSHPFLRNIGLAIRSLRRERGISQESLAGLANIDRSYMSSVERGLRNVSVLNVARIATALGVPVWELLRLREVRSGVMARAIEPDPPMALESIPAVPRSPMPEHVTREWEPRYLSLG